MLALLFVLAGLILGLVGAWLHNARLVGVGVACVAAAELVPRL